MLPHQAQHCKDPRRTAAEEAVIAGSSCRGGSCAGAAKVAEPVSVKSVAEKLQQAAAASLARAAVQQRSLRACTDFNLKSEVQIGSPMDENTHPEALLAGNF